MSNFMTKPPLPYLQQTVVNTILIINISNSNNLNKFWVDIFTRQGHINKVYLLTLTAVRQSVSDKHSQWSDSGPIKNNRMDSKILIFSWISFEWMCYEGGSSLIYCHLLTYFCILSNNILLVYKIFVNCWKLIPIKSKWLITMRGCNW